MLPTPEGQSAASRVYFRRRALNLSLLKLQIFRNGVVDAVSHCS